AAEQLQVMQQDPKAPLSTSSLIRSAVIVPPQTPVAQSKSRIEAVAAVAAVSTVAAFLSVVGIDAALARRRGRRARRAAPVATDSPEATEGTEATDQPGEAEPPLDGDWDPS